MFHKKLALLKLKELLITLFSFLLVTMSLYHVFFESKDPGIKKNNTKYINFITERSNKINLYLQQLDNKEININEYNALVTDIFFNSRKVVKELNDEKRKLSKKFSFRGRVSFHYWLFVFGLVTLGAFFSCKSLYCLLYTSDAADD